MIFLKFAFGILCFFLGWVYLYKSNILLNLNRIAREVVFNDRLILLERKRLAIVFFCLSFVALYMGFSSLTGWLISKDRNSWTSENKQYLMYMAMQDYCTERYAAAIDKYQRILKADPNNPEVMKRMAYTYGAWGEKKKARVIWHKLLRVNPNDQEIRKELKSIEK